MEQSSPEPTLVSAIESSNGAEKSQKQKKKPGPKPKKTIDIDSLELKVQTLETVLSRLAVMTGQGNMLLEYGLNRWEPNKKHMSKYG